MDFTDVRVPAGAMLGAEGVLNPEPEMVDR